MVYHNDHHHTGTNAFHTHEPGHFGKAFAIGIALNTAYVVAEAFYGIAAHSLALLADAAHNLGDILGLAGAWVASVLARRHPSSRYTYGLRGGTILAALGNAVVLLVVTGGIAWEAIQRLWIPEYPAGLTIIVVAGLGVAINGITALLFISGRERDLNIKGAFLYMASDALVALGVVLAGALIFWTNREWLDPTISLIISVVIVVSTWSLLRDSVNLAINAVPEGVDHGDVTNYLASRPGVTAVHDLHIWGMSTTEVALTAHLIRPNAGLTDEFLHHTSQGLEKRFGIVHATLQIETADGMCRLAPDEVV